MLDTGALSDFVPPHRAPVTASAEITFLEIMKKIPRFSFPDLRLRRTLNQPKKNVRARLGVDLPGERPLGPAADAAEEVNMTPLLVACLCIGAPVAGLGFLELQARLEQWDQRRHADD
jgi:hypothetical protein